MNWTLEVIVVPVSDVDRSKEFYADRLGFDVDVDTGPGDGHRVVQLTPPGSGCSVTLLTQGGQMKPGTLKGVQLCVADLEAARAELVERGVDASEIQVFDMSGAQRPYREGDSLDTVGFVFFEDPDGNGWAVQQMPGRS
jgi:catechol 2,3-dioxygenase-like lactoylglutathione lyase family enzyme